MKKLHIFKISFFIVYIISCTSVSKANWLKSEGKTSTPYTQHTPNPQHTLHSDSLPSGVTKDWLNKLTDERGDKIIPEEEEPVPDALQQNTFNGGAAGITYGRSVSSAGDVNGDGFDDVIIGAPNSNGGGTNSGRAYIYFGGTLINISVDVTLTGATTNNYFGTSVSSAGDVNGDGYDDVIVGAPGYNSFTGRAYIYYGGTTMDSFADVIMTGESTSNDFGRSVSTAGDVNNDGFSDVIVGANAANVYTGKAYIYYGGSSMNNTSDVIMTGQNSNDNFGYSVSGAGDVNGDGYHDVICGADGFNGTGRAYIYFGGASMNNVADVIMIGGAIADFFGASVSNAGDVNDDGFADVIVGAWGFNNSTGRTYIFFGGVSMNSIADVIMTGEATNNAFGYSVSEAGDINGDGFADVYVGAYGYSTSKGRAYLYYGGTNMNNVVDIYMTGDTTLNLFGYSVSGAGDVNGDGFADMIVGAYGYNSSTGRAYVYTNTMRGEDLPDVIVTGEAAGNYLGISVSYAGDINSDGYSDVIVGAYGTSTISGKAHIFFGSPTMDNSADVTLTDGVAGNHFGFSVSAAGDVNGDGFDDVIVGAPRYNTYTGKTYIFFGGGSMNNVADVIMTGETVNNDFGRSVSSAGDVNGDGYDDVIVGAKGYSSSTGRAYVFFGGGSMNNIADVTMTGENVNNNFGVSVSSAGDVNGDGYDDVITGANGYNSSSGRAYIFFGGSLMNNIADVILTGEATSNFFGYSVSDAGDINGDGYDDVIAGAFGYSSVTGRTYIFFGGSLMNNVADVTMTGENVNIGFGASVSSAGDVNGDGFDDVIVGSVIGGVQSDPAYIFYGGSDMNNVSDVKMINEVSRDIFGYSVSGAGDLNGDGYSDVIIGAPDFMNELFRPGKACIYLSSPPNNRKNLFLFGAIQGMYDPVFDTEIPDTIKVYLRNFTSPFARVDSSKNILIGPQTGQYFLFRNVQNDKPYYIEVTHRNALTTWSAVPVTFVNSDASIAYSVNSTYAYGNNEIQVDNNPYDVFAFYSGDVNHDGFIDLTDVLEIYNDANSFLTGYVVTDLTGNDVVDLTDVLMAYNNSVNFVSVVKP